MIRWNGWGDETTIYPLPPSAERYLALHIGEGTSIPDAAFTQVVASVPPSRFTSQPFISVDPAERLRHARGQSLPDWIALRSGRIGVFPDGVAYPASEDEVRSAIRFARDVGAKLIPFGGGSSVVGHINPVHGDAAVITLDLTRLNRLFHFDGMSRLATFEAGVRGPDLESQLRARGCTLGHYPQSFEFSTLGGWIATRSSGQQSYHYGRIENLFAGGRVQTPIGDLDLPPLPASAAGPDLRQMILGSEGRFGVITRAILRVRSLPQHENFYAIFFRDWASGIEAVREIAQQGVGVSMLRLSDPQETETTLALAGRDQLVAWADRGLRALRYGSERCLLIFGVTGDEHVFGRARAQTMDVARAHGGLFVGDMIGKLWRKNRFLAPYLRNTLWEKGYALDTLETALPWSSVSSAAAAIKVAIRSAMEETGERVLVFAHLSHVYADGASIYVTYLYRRSSDPDETLHCWQRMKGAASKAIVEHGGTISHQHGVGLDHAPYLAAEKGEVGMTLLEATRRTLDPDGLLNPKKLIGEI